MYSVVLMAALSAGGQAPDCHLFSGSCGCTGGGYSSCGGGYGCYGCYGSYGGCHGCYGGGGYGSAWYGACYGSYAGWNAWSNGCNGCWGSYGNDASPYFPTVPPGVSMPPAKGDSLPLPRKDGPETLAPNSARLIVELPADAKFSIDDQVMKTTSERRTFKTPELDRGQTYYYVLKAEVIRDGKPVVETKRVLVRAGEEVHADFSGMEAVSTAKSR